MSAHTAVKTQTTNQALLSALQHCSPVIMGFLPVGAAFGVLAQKTGMSMLNTVLMSVMVYAGSSQLVAVAMLAAGLAPATIIATTFVVNLRHMLMSASLAPNLRGWKAWQLAAFGYEVTDETFALHTTRFSRGDHDTRTTFLINAICHGTWVLASWLGYAAGTAIPAVEPLGLDYALPAMFIGLLVAQTATRLHVAVAVLSGAAAVLMTLSGADNWSVILATILGATFGAGAETWMKRHSS
ncbi:AzlC family ABC transporter permease [Pseudodesulfovibrio tunisiensis]|uniref:AzlC family ABC transporter permease n=1 Tax=Pseudodesulfovibrio tunisiensis TaxID=463192 RepID=UPI001FB3AD2A|nr:AzlC family ABC transporter permease [Pseudodesulfovibrio tunisiensis]